MQISVWLVIAVVLFGNASLSSAAENKGCEAFPRKFLSLDKISMKHPIETRGYVQAPFSYTGKATPSIQLFYRVIPSAGRPENLATKPYLVIFHGGPGFSSRHNRALDYDYASSPRDRLTYLSPHFNIILMDPRGTDGNSTQLNFNNKSLDPNFIIKHFSFDTVARDYALVINAVVPKKAKLYIIAQSAGGLVAANYIVESLSDPIEVRRPVAIAFTSSALPNQTASSSLDQVIDRVKALRVVNEKLAKMVPTLPAELLMLQARIKNLRPKSLFFDSLFNDLLKTQYPGAEFAFQKKIRDLTNNPDLADVIDEHDNSDPVMALNYILSAGKDPEGRSDRTLFALAERKVEPYLGWMINEAFFYQNVTSNNPAHQRLIELANTKPIKPVEAYSNSDIKRGLSQIRTVFTLAHDDTAVAINELRKAIEAIRPMNAQLIEFENGGHGAAFTEENVRRLVPLLLSTNGQ